MADFDLQCLFVCPDRALADAFLQTVPALRAFQILGDLKSYPTDQALEMRLRQLEPDVVLLDLASDPARAGQITETVLRARPGTQVVGLHPRNDGEALVASLRRGASEFLAAPFATDMQIEAIGRIRRLLRPKPALEREAGQVICFSAVKPGAGTTMLALESALAIARQTSTRVLLIDADLAGGTLASATGLSRDDATDLPAVLSGEAGSNWPRRTLRMGPIELLPSSSNEATIESGDLSRLAEVFESARQAFDWVIVDLPSIYERISLVAAASADSLFLVSTGELPSLHLGRRAVGLLQSLGFAKNAIRVLANRMSKRDGLGPTELEKIFSTRVEVLLPQDYQGLHQKAADGGGIAQPIGPATELGKAISIFSARLVASVVDKKKTAMAEEAVAVR